MTVFVLVFALGFTAFFGVLFAVVVGLRPPELPLSVRVPQAHANDQVVRSAIRRFRVSLLVMWLVTAAVTTVLVSVDLPALATVIPVLLYAGLTILALVLSRRLIIRAKRQGNWFEGVPGRVSAQLTPPSYRHPPFIWAVLAAIVLAGATAVGVALYPTLPDPLPIHFTIAGVANAWAPKSVWSVFGLLMIGAAVATLLTALSVAAARYSVRVQPGDTAEQAALRTQVQRGMLTSLLAELAFVLALGISAIDVTQRLAPGARGVIAVCVIAMVVLIMVVIISNVARGRVQLRPANVRSGENPRPDSIDDDEHWKGGLFYVNRDDPALVVPRRFGLGWTLNFGRPAGVVLTITLLLVIVGGGIVPLLLVTHAR